MSNNTTEVLILGELKDDNVLLERLTKFNDSLAKVKELVETMCKRNDYDLMTDQDKIRYDLFLAFSITSCYWLYLRTKGIDPNQHELKKELKRVQEYMEKSKKQHERSTMPRVDQEAAKRFVRSGLFDPNAKSDEKNSESVCKKRKRENSDSN